MKRTYPANINGQIFYIDEDAYLMLQDYLLQLKATFRGPEGEEIVADIESRIREHFDERIEAGSSVIVLGDVTGVIETMGRPEQISEDSGVSAQPAQAAGTAEDELAEDSEKPFVSFNIPSRKRLYRNMKNKVFGGVFGGLATYLGWNANIMRLLYAALTCLTYFWPLTVLYLILWMIIPPATTPRRVLELKGEPVTPGTVGQTVIANSPAVADVAESDLNENFFTTFFGIVGKVIMAFLGLIGAVAGFGLLVGFIAVAICLLCSYGWNIPVEILDLPPLDNGLMYTVAVLIWLLAGAVACGALVWAACSVLFNTRGASRATKITTLIMEILLIAAGIASIAIANAL